MQAIKGRAPARSPVARGPRLATALSLLFGVLGACSLRGASDGTASSTGTSELSSGQGAANASSAASSSAGVGPKLPATFEVTGRVLDQDGLVVPDALVLQAGRSDEPPIATGTDGSFVLTMIYGGFGTPTVVASRRGYRTIGLEFSEVPSAPIELVLRAIEPPDNEAYSYGAPGHGKDPSTAFCGHCHDSIAAEFQTSKHAQATRNPLVQDLYAGVAGALQTKVACDSAGGQWRSGRVPGSSAESAAKCYLGTGVLPALNALCGTANTLTCDDPLLPVADRPTQFGGCADCHSPGMNGKAGGRNLLEATGIAYENGVHCDFCHKVAEVALEKPPGVGGRLRVQRPSETFGDGGPGAKVRQAMFGPLIDVPNPNMGGSLQPQFATAVFCAGCHEALQPALVPGTTLAPRFSAGLPVHSTYSEWLLGPYSGAGVPCQHCHMPANEKLDSAADLGNAVTASITFGFPRPSNQIRKHIFRSPLVQLSPQGLRLIDSALTSSSSGVVAAGQLEVDVAVGNIGCGHAVPTGDPMRAVVMFVEATCNGVPLSASGGMTIDDIGGAKSRGIVGGGVTLAESSVSWLAAKGVAKVGDRVRVVRALGAFHDYDGVGLFAGTSLLPSQKGMPIFEPIGEASVSSLTATGFALDRPISGAMGDVVYLGDPTQSVDGQSSLALSGAPGIVFAKVLIDEQGGRQVPHFRGTDIVSDNRIAPTKVHHSAHRFALPGTCTKTTATVQVTLLYRPIPLAEASLRAWKAVDYRIGSSTSTIAVP